MRLTGLAVGAGVVGPVGERLRSRFAFEWTATDRSVAARTGQTPTFERADTDGTVIDRHGRVRPTGYALPRWSAYDLDGDGVREATALMLERTRTNLVTHSEDLANAAWLAAAGGLPTQTGGQADPMGGTGAYLLNDADAGVRGQYIGVTFGSNGTKSAAIFLKRGTAASPEITLHDLTAALNRHRVGVTWGADGVPVLSTNFGGGTLFPPERCADGWWRVSFTATGIVSANTNRFFIYPASFSNGAATGSVYAFGAQVEDEDFPSSYIRTTGATAQRVFENLWYSWLKLRVLPVTAYCRFVETGARTSAISTVALNLGNSPGRFVLERPASAAYRWAFYPGTGFPSATPNLSGVVPGDVLEYCGSLDALGRIVAEARRNRGAIARATSTTTWPFTTWGGTALVIGSTGSNSAGNGSGWLDVRVAYGVKSLEEMTA